MSRDGPISAFDFFGGVPLSILYNDTTLAVAQILGDGTRKREPRRSPRRTHHLFEDRFGRPARGNDEGRVEGMVGCARRSFPVPIPRARDVDEPNGLLLERLGAPAGRAAERGFDRRPPGRGSGRLP